MMENDNQKFNIEMVLRMPGTIASIYVVSVITYLLGFYDLSFALATSFSAPFIILFVVESLLNRSISVKTHIIFLGVISYLFFMLSHYEDLTMGMDSIINTHLTFFIGLSSALCIMLLYYGLYQFFPSKDRRTLFFVAFIPAVVIPSAILYVLSGQMGVAEASGENVSFVDLWSVWHVLVSFAVGIIAYPIIKKLFGEKANGGIKFGIALGVPIFFEVIEQSILKNILGLTPEFIGNSMADIILGACAIYVGYEISEYVNKNDILDKLQLKNVKK